MKKIFLGIISLIVVISGGLFFVTTVRAESSVFMSVSPMRESVVLNPGDTYMGSFVVSNPGYSERDLNYHVDIKPFYMDENYRPVFDESMEIDKQMIKDWIEITDGKNGVIPPNEVRTVKYVIKVPENAPAGGQYACISTTTDITPGEGNGVNIGEGMAINHVVLAEIAGSTVESGEILDMGMQNFLLGGRIAAYSVVKNTGNIHSLATYTMKIRSVFTGEELFNNEGDAESHFVLPDRTFFNEMYWEDTPTMGIFDVMYTVDYQGQKNELNRVVIVCPWWLLLVIVFGMVILTMRVVSLVRIKKEVKAVEKAKETESKKN